LQEGSWQRSKQESATLVGGCSAAYGLGKRSRQEVRQQELQQARVGAKRDVAVCRKTETQIESIQPPQPGLQQQPPRRRPVAVRASARRAPHFPGQKPPGFHRWLRDARGFPDTARSL